MNSATIVRSDLNSVLRERGPSRKKRSSGSGSGAWTCSDVPSGRGLELTALGYRADESALVSSPGFHSWAAESRSFASLRMTEEAVLLPFRDGETGLRELEAGADLVECFARAVFNSSSARDRSRSAVPTSICEGSSARSARTETASLATSTKPEESARDFSPPAPL